MRDSVSMKKVVFLNSSGSASIKSVVFLNPLAVNMNEKKQTNPWHNSELYIEEDLKEALKYVSRFYIFLFFWKRGYTIFNPLFNW